MKKILCLMLSVLLIVGLALTFASCRGTAAYWREQTQQTSDEDARIATVNGSEKYIVYAALSAGGDLITSGTAAKYAVVGYTGLVAELTIPATYGGLPVTKVLVAPSEDGYLLYCGVDSSGHPVSYSGDDVRLRTNTVVTSIRFGSNVTTVGAGVCLGMTNLASIAFTAASPVTLGDAAFAACASLTTVTGSWTAASGADPFTASGYTPPSP